MSILLALFFCMWGFALQADSSALLYSKTTLRILPHNEKKPAIVSTKDAKDKNALSQEPLSTVALPVLPRIAKEFEVEVRPLSFLSQRDFISHQPFTDKEGMMIIIDPPQDAALGSTNLLTSADVLFVTEDGVITQIAPDLSLRDITEPVQGGKPIRAFIFLKSGMAKASDIIPGDRVENAIFHSEPVVLQAPTSK